MRTTRWLAVPAALLLAAGCQPKGGGAETPEQAQTRMDAESAAARTAIDSLEKEFMTHFNMGHGDIVAGYYTETAHVMPPNDKEAVGRQAIAAAMAPFFAMKPTLTLASVSVEANGPVAIEQGTYSMSFTPPGAKEPMNDTGKYLAHWHNVGGHWLMAHDIWNSDMPAMPMGPPPAAGKKP